MTWKFSVSIENQKVPIFTNIKGAETNRTAGGIEKQANSENQPNLSVVWFYDRCHLLIATAFTDEHTEKRKFIEKMPKNQPF